MYGSTEHGLQSWPHHLGKSVTGHTAQISISPSSFTNPLEGACKSYNIDRDVHPKESVCLVLTARLRSEQQISRQTTTKEKTGSITAQKQLFGKDVK